jgi:hypothetical protein
MRFVSSLSLEIQARSLVVFLAAQREALSLSDAVTLVSALDGDEEKNVARQLAALLKQRHSIELKHTNALKVIGLMSGRSGWHRPSQLTPYRLTATNPAGGTPVLSSRHTSLKGALAELITVFGRETASYHGPRFAHVTFRGRALQFECEFVGALHTRWVIDMDPVESGGQSWLDIQEARWCVERFRRELEERWRGGLLTGALSAEQSQDENFGDTLIVRGPGFEGRERQPGWGEIAALRELELALGTEALRDAQAPEHGVLVAADKRFALELFGVRNNDHESMGFITRTLPAEAISRLIRRYRRLCEGWGSSLAELATGHWESAPAGEPRMRLNVKRLHQLVAQKKYDFSEMRDTSGVDPDELDEALGGGHLRASHILTLARYLDVSGNELLQVTPELRMLFSTNHLAGEIVNATEFDVTLWSHMDDGVRDTRIAEAKAILRRFPGTSAVKVAADLFEWARASKLSIAATRAECFSLETTGEAAFPDIDPDSVYEVPGRRMTLVLQAR